MPTTARRLAPVVLAGLLILTLAVPAGAVPLSGGGAAAPAIASQSPSWAELKLVERTNRKRTDRGLVPVRMDLDLMAVAHDRAVVMAASNTLSHTEPDGRTVFDRLSDAGVHWYYAGEIIAYNTYATTSDSVRAAIRSWMHSDGHRKILLSAGVNYVGFGAATASNGRRYYAGVFVKQPDETSPRASLTTLSKRSVDADRIRVRVGWGGKDRRLQVLTSGLRYYEVGWRRVGGAWHSWGTTTSTSRAKTWARGVAYEVRVRSRDWAGNWSAWRTIRIRT